MGANSPSARQAARILVVEDDAAIKEQLAEGLQLDGHKVFTAEDVASAKRRLRRNELDLVLLDINLPDESGYELLRELRAGSIGDGSKRRVPVVMLSGRSAEVDRVRGFELGCDDYVVKPYSFGELRGRVGAVLRRARGAAAGDVIEVGTLRIDRRARAVFVEDRLVSLTVKEFSLLMALAQDPGRVFTREELLKTVWGYRTAGSTRTLDAHACRLRAKLCSGREHFVINLWGVGYRLTEVGEERQ
ncbi:MAG: response regulator transcription factor [Solirubrobacterales bacterium]